MDVMLAAQIVARWTSEEAHIFFESFSHNGRAWARIAADIRTKTAEQARIYYESLLLLIRHLLGQLDFPFDFNEPHDCFLALVTYYSLVAEAVLAPFSPDFNAQMLDRIRRQKLGFLRMKQSRSMAADTRAQKLALRLVPRAALLSAHLRYAKLTPYLKLTVTRGKPMASIVQHLAKKWAAITDESTGTLFVHGKWRVYPLNSATHFGWGDNDGKVTIGEVYDALGQPDDFSMLYDCSMKPTIAPTLVSSLPLSSSPAVDIAPSHSAVDVLGVSATPAVPKPVEKKVVRRKPKLPRVSKGPCVDAQGNLYGAFSIAPRRSGGRKRKAAPSSPIAPLAAPSPRETPKQDEMKSAFEEKSAQSTTANHWHEGNALGDFPDAGTLAADLDALNEVSLSSLLLQGEFNFGHLTQAPSELSFFQQAVNSQAAPNLTDSFQFPSTSSATALSEAASVSTAPPSPAPPIASASHLLASSQSQSNFDVLFGDSMGVSLDPRGIPSTALGAMGTARSSSLLDYGFSFGGSNSNSGDGVFSGKKRLFSDVSNGTRFDDDDWSDFSTTSGFVPFGGSPESNKRARTSVFDRT